MNTGKIKLYGIGGILTLMGGVIAIDRHDVATNYAPSMAKVEDVASECYFKKRRRRRTTTSDTFDCSKADYYRAVQPEYQSFDLKKSLIITVSYNTDDYKTYTGVLKFNPHRVSEFEHLEVGDELKVLVHKTEGNKFRGPEGRERGKIVDS